MREHGKTLGQLVLAVAGIAVGCAVTYVVMIAYRNRLIEDAAPARLRFEQTSRPFVSPEPTEPAVGDELDRHAPEPAGLLDLENKTLREKYDITTGLIRTGDWKGVCLVAEEMAKHGEEALVFLNDLLHETTNPDVAVAVTRAIGGIASDLSVRLLISILQDEELAHARKGACLALERSDDIRIVPAVIDIIKAGAERGEAELPPLQLLAHKGGREVTDFFVGVLRDSTYDDVAKLAAACIGEFKDGGDLVQPVMELLHGMNFKDRSFSATTLAHGLSNVADARVARGLVVLLGDERALLENKQAIAEGAVLTGDIGALQDLLDIARFSNDPPVRYCVLSALKVAGEAGKGKPGVEAYRPIIVGVLIDTLRDPDYLARASACVGLAGAGDETAVSMLEQRAELDSSSRVKREAKRALQAIRKRQKESGR